MRSRAFTLIEILIVAGIAIVLLGVGSLFLGGNNRALRVGQSADTLTALLKTAQANARQQAENSRWGVQIDNAASPARYSAFVVDESLLADPEFTDVPGTTTQRLIIPSGVVLTNPPASSFMRIIFNKGTGLPTYATSVTLESSVGASSTHTVFIDQNGRIGE